jgi:hypothetical protein
MSGSPSFDRKIQTPSQPRDRDYADEPAPHPSVTSKDPTDLGIIAASA